jgi:hypothetical protein
MLNERSLLQLVCNLLKLTDTLLKMLLTSYCKRVHILQILFFNKFVDLLFLKITHLK